jgi:hypothetical protein
MCLSVFPFCVSTVSVMAPYLGLVFNTWVEYHELLLVLQIACICFVCLVRNVLPVCPMYFSGQSKHFIW